MPEKNVQVNTDRGLPYERFLQFGPENLTEAELLAVILRTGTKEDSAVALAEKVLALAKPERGSASPERIMWRNILWKNSDTGIPNVCICSVWMPKDS